MTKKFEVGSYAINNKGIGIAGPQSTIYKVVSIENVTSGVAYVISLPARRLPPLRWGMNGGA